MLTIITAPHSILAQMAKPVAKIDAAILDLIEKMKAVLLAAKDPEGVGLAAPQVGKPLKIFIVKPTPKSPIQIFINPRIVSGIKYKVLSKDKKIHNTKLEGCLSLPNIWGEVDRSSTVALSYLDEKGNAHERKFKSLSATIIQHEIDHLNGILFPKIVLEQKGTLYKSHKDGKNEDVFEEIEI